jgi:DNA mismatch repair protein MutH
MKPKGLQHRFVGCPLLYVANKSWEERDMPEIEVSVECQACGQILDVTVKRGNEIHVKPCSGCMDDAYNKGFDKGKEAIQCQN